MATATAPERYTVVSADGHAGADLLDYKPYLASRWHDDFDAWAAAYVNPYADLLAPIAYRSWDSARRLAETESDGIAAEVLFPNTVPPFFAEGNLVALPPTPDDYERRWAGVQAHNRWPGILRRRARPAGRHHPGVRQRHGGRAVRGPLGRLDLRPLRGDPVALDPAQLPPAPSGRTTTSRCGGSVPNSTCPSTSTAEARCPTTGSTRPRGR